MPKVTCVFCGRPFSVRSVREGADNFCCSGCALASRIPIGDEAFPVSRGLIVALVLGFGLFNQVLFGVLGSSLVADGRTEAGTWLLMISVGIGALLWLAFVGFLFTTRTRRLTDVMAGGLGGALAAWAIARFGRDGVPVAMGPLLLANVWLALWWSRGWVRKYFQRRRTTA